MHYTMTKKYLAVAAIMTYMHSIYDGNFFLYFLFSHILLSCLDMILPSREGKLAELEGRAERLEEGTHVFQVEPGGLTSPHSCSSEVQQEGEEVSAAGQLEGKDHLDCSGWSGTAGTPAYHTYMTCVWLQFTYVH